MEIETGGEVVETAPGEAGACGGGGDAVVVAACDVRDGAVGAEAGDEGWVEDVEEVVFAGEGGYARLAIVIQAPGVDVAVFVDGEGVVGAGADVDDVFFQADGLG